MGVEQVHAAGARHRQHLGLEVVVAQHEVADFIGHFGEQFVALLLGQFAFFHGEIEQNLDIDFMVGAIDAGRVVDGVSAHAAAIQREFDAAELGHAEIAAFADHLAAQFAAIDADGVVGTIADRDVGFLAGFDVGADAAVVEQVDRGQQQGVD